MKMNRLSKSKVLILLMMVSLFLFATGCGLVDKLVSMKQDVEEPEISLGEQGASDLDFEEFVLEEKDEDAKESEAQDDIKITLFFGDQLGQFLVTEERSIPRAEGIGRATVNELIKGPDFQSGLLPTIPDNTVLLDINVRQEEGLAIVDFSRALVDNHIGGSSAETLTVYSIVNTLTQFPTVDEVQILVDGHYVETLAGHLDVSQPLTSKDSLTQ